MNLGGVEVTCRGSQNRFMEPFITAQHRLPEICRRFRGRRITVGAADDRGDRRPVSSYKVQRAIAAV